MPVHICADCILPKLVNYDEHYWAFWLGDLIYWRALSIYRRIAVFGVDTVTPRPGDDWRSFIKAMIGFHYIDALQNTKYLAIDIGNKAASEDITTHDYQLLLAHDAQPIRKHYKSASQYKSSEELEKLRGYAHEFLISQSNNASRFKMPSYKALRQPMILKLRQIRKTNYNTHYMSPRCRMSVLWMATRCRAFHRC